MRTETCFTPLEGEFEINRLHSSTWKNGRWWKGFTQGRQVWLENAPNSQVCICRQGCVWLSWRSLVRGCEYLGCHCRRDKFPLAPHLEGSLPPAKTSMVRKPHRFCVLRVSDCAEREVTGTWAFSTLDKQPFPSSPTLLWHNRTKREEKHSCTSWILPWRWHGPVYGASR